MSADLDTRLRALTDVSPASRAPLGTEELHGRATKRRQRAIAVRAIPAAVVVIAVLAGAFALQGRSTTTDVVVSPPDATQVPDASSISERDLQVIDFLRAAAELRRQLDREMVLSATYASTDGASGRAELQTQRAATDEAAAAYAVGRQDVVPADGSVAVDELALVEAITQADNRLERLDVSRRSVDAIQADALSQIDAYANTSAALQAIPAAYLQEVEDPAVFRGVLSASNLGTLAMTEAAMAATLTISVEIGFYAGALPRGLDPTILRGDCGEDAEGAGDACPPFAVAIDRMNERDRLEATFVNDATGEQKQLYRAAQAGSDVDQLVASAFEDGVGINDLRGIVPGSVAIDPVTWRAATLDQIDRLAAVEQQLFDQVVTGS